MTSEYDRQQDQKVDRIVAEVLRRQEDGFEVDLEELVAEFPDVADSIREYFTNALFVAQLAERISKRSIDTDAAEQHDTDVSPASNPAELEVSPLKNELSSVAALPEEYANGSRLFGRYRIERLLGEGAMGAVYRAYDTKLGRRVALKAPKQCVADSQRFLVRFHREAQAAATLHHRNICPVFDVGEVDGIHYLTMAYIRGKSLADLIRTMAPLRERQAVLVTRKVAAALAVAHEAGIVHRDLKPSNIMIDRSSEPIVMDFGLAGRVGNEQNTRLTQVGTILGTPAYMSPEQVNGDPQAVGPQSDIYSLGVVLYELLSGKLPFQGSAPAVMAKILVETPQDLAELRPDVDPRLVAICSKMMEKSPAERFSSMSDLADSLSKQLRRDDSPPVIANSVNPNTFGGTETELVPMKNELTRPFVDAAQHRDLIVLPTRRRLKIRWLQVAGGVMALFLLGVCAGSWGILQLSNGESLGTTPLVARSAVVVPEIEGSVDEEDAETGLIANGAIVGTYHGHRYLVTFEELTWGAARVRCLEMGGDLVQIDDAAENEFLTNLVSRESKASVHSGARLWIGLSYRGDDDWRWIDDAKLSYTNWQQQPKAVNVPQRHVFPIDPRRTYLRTSPRDPGLPAIPIDLRTLGLAPGDRIQLERLGSYTMGANQSRLSLLCGAFSRSSILNSHDDLHRVRDAIDAGENKHTHPTWESNGRLETNIAEDFAIADFHRTFSSIEIVIPHGATHLFVAPPLGGFYEVKDADGDFAVAISLLSKGAQSTERYACLSLHELHLFRDGGEWLRLTANDTANAFICEWD